MRLFWGPQKIYRLDPYRIAGNTFLIFSLSHAFENFHPFQTLLRGFHQRQVGQWNIRKDGNCGIQDHSRHYSAGIGGGVQGGTRGIRYQNKISVGPEPR